jgi:FAD/FMN-containing dehydrogenase
MIEASAMIESLRVAFSGTLLTEPDDVAPFLTDWRKSWCGTAIAVAMPDSVVDVAQLVRWCAAHEVRIVPQGGNTSQSGGSVPEGDGRNLVLSLTRLNRIRAIDLSNNTITVDAGCILETVQRAASDVGRLFPLSLGAEGSCTIGGNLATNAGGTAVLRYGNARDLCLGIEVVTADGKIWNGLKGLRKDNSGYDLRNLFIGSEGTLGVITGAVLKLFPKPAGRVVAFVAVKTCDDALSLLTHLKGKLDTSLTAFELMSDICLALALDHVPNAKAPLGFTSPWYLLIECTDMQSDENARAALEASLAAALDAGLIQDATIAGSLSQSRALWQLRETISEAQGAVGKAIKHDIAIPISSIAAFVRDALTAVETAYPAYRPVIFGHLGDGNLHFNFSSAEGADQVDFVAQQPVLNRIVHDLVRAYDGTISAEHGLGVLRRDEADSHRDPTERHLMTAIKSALDPHGMMNPGKLLPFKQADNA